MSDSVDRVFVHALATVRRLPRTGSSRPPPTARLRLYGLYKQSMEGDVSAILSRPDFPPNSPNPNDPGSSNPTVHRYASRDVRTRELQSEIEKWDAWHSCAGMTRTEAKRRYITTLIETMKEYASGTSESRELVSELEFVWNQIKSQSGSDESESGESPTRKLERAGLKRTQSILTDEAIIPGLIATPTPIPSPPAEATPKPPAPKGSLFSRIQNSVSNLSATQLRPQQNLLGLKVLSPISVSNDDIVENEEIPPESPKSPYQTTPSTPVARTPRAAPPPATPRGDDRWRRSIEAQLKQLTLELTALREQLSSHHLLSRSSFSSPFPSHYHPLHYASLPIYRRLLYQFTSYLRYILWTVLRQLMIQLGMLSLVLVYGRVKGDRRVEDWVKGRIKDLGGWGWVGGTGRVVRMLQGRVL